MNRPLTPEEEATMRGCDEQDFASDSEPMRLWATLDAEREKVRVLREAVVSTRRIAALHMKARGFAAESIAESFPDTDRALATTEPKP